MSVCATPRHLPVTPVCVKHISREHPAIVYGDHIEDLKVAAPVLGMKREGF